MLTDEERRTQRDITEAYRWVYRVTEESGALLTDATRLMSERGLEDEEGLKSYYGQKLPPDSWPYVFFLARVFLHPDEKTAGTGIFLAISLGNERQGFEPRLYAGTLKWTGEDAQTNHSPIYSSAVDAKHYGRFAITGHLVFRAEPNQAGRQNHKGIDEVRWFAIPLAWVSTPERLVRIVDATVALRTGSDDGARNLVIEMSQS